MSRITARSPAELVASCTELDLTLGWRAVANTFQPHLQHLAVASSAGTSLEANLKHITVTLATWDALEKDMAEVSMERHGHAKQLVVFFFGAAGIGTGGGPSGADQRRGRAVLVDEHRTTRVSSAVNGKQPCEEELDHEQPTRRAGWKPPAGQVDLRLLRLAWSQQRDQPVWDLMWCSVVAPRKPPQAPRSSQEAAEPTQPTKGKGKAQGKAAKAKPAPQLGRWMDRDCNAALKMQRIWGSRWRPLELC
ncbi:hypothetical protein QJQ45_017128 [Haematococcus lacustris]|nr:hypothetical protein QJQ45_017128 [Haematococcus lacustris]